MALKKLPCLLDAINVQGIMKLQSFCKIAARLTRPLGFRTSAETVVRPTQDMPLDAFLRFLHGMI